MPDTDKKGKGNAAAHDEAQIYKLKTQAVDDLINADESNSPEVSEQEIRKYKSGKDFRLPAWLEVVFIKFWFAAAVCYFFVWGLGGYLQTVIDQLFVLGVALGIITDLLTNNVIRFFAISKNSNDHLMMFPKRSYMSFVGNILYSFVIIFLVYTAYTAINLAVIRLQGGTADTLPLGVEPLIFGLLCLAADMMFVGFKRLFKRILNDAKRDVQSGSTKTKQITN